MVRVIAASILFFVPFQHFMSAATADEVDAQLDAQFRLEQAEEQAFKEAAVLASPSIVKIDTVGGLDIVGRTLTSTAPTTGLIISEDGFIVSSAFNFLSKPASVLITLPDGRRFPAKTVATDRLRMVTLLKIEVNGLKVPTPAPKAGIKVGQWSIALGRTYDSALPSISVGIVSAINRVWGKAIQTDAKISPVNYGGPLIDLNGYLRGILVPLSPSDSGDQIRAGVEWYDSGIGFAIPMADALQVAEKLREGKDRFRGVMGIRPSTRNPLAKEVSIKSVLPKSPADTAGLKAGDRITAVGGKVVDRFGVFDSVVKTSYAGQSLSVSILRGEDAFEFEVPLVQKLNRPKPGYSGLLVGAKVGEDENDDVGVLAYPFVDSPAQAAGLPETLIVTKWGDKDVKSASDLQNVLRSTVADTKVEISFRENQGATEIQQAVIALTDRPALSPLPTEAIQKIVANGVDAEEWSRNEEKLGDDGKVWFYAPKADPQRTSGVVVLLSDAETAHEVVLNRWKDVCRQYNLLLIVPSNTQGTALTQEDGGLLPLVFATALAGRRLDVTRSVLVARAEQEGLCTDVLLNPRLRQLRSAAYIECWPAVSGVSPEALVRKSPSVLLLGGKIESRQSRALRDQAVRRLTDARIWVVQENGSEISGVTPEERIALWTIGLKAR